MTVKIPADWPVQPLQGEHPIAARLMTCYTCGNSWDDAVPTSYTPTPSGRCPFENFHVSILGMTSRTRVGAHTVDAWMNQGAAPPRKPAEKVDDIDLPAWVEDIVDAWDADTLRSYAIDSMLNNLEHTPQDQIVEEYNDFYSDAFDEDAAEG